jgi:hypothetical protein
MPHKKLARRFEPKFGVSQLTLETEAKWIGRELEDKLLGSTNELKQQLSQLQAKMAVADESLRTTLARIPDRERLALKCMLARDMFHIAALYETFLQSSEIIRNATGVVTEAPEELDQQGKAQPVLVFTESLFG